MRNFILSAVLALFVSFTTGTSASADMGMPGMKPARPSHQVIASESFLDHVFVVYRPQSLRVKDGNGNETQQDVSEAEYAEPTPDNPIMVPHDEDKFRVGAFRVFLVIAPREAATRYKSALDLAKAVRAGQVVGAVQFEFPYKESVLQWSDPDITITYRVQRVENGDRLEVVRLPEKKFPCCFVGLLCPVVMGLCGILIFPWWWRQQRKIPTP